MKADLTYDAIVVGAGIAGLTSAAYLGKYGHRTLLCEAGEKVGGLASSFEFSGFTFDAGIRAFENSGIIFPMLKELGIAIDFVRNPVSIGIGDQMVKLLSKESLGDYEALLCRQFPQNGKDIQSITGEIKKVMGYMDVLYGIDNPLFLDFTKDRQYLVKTLLPWLIKYQFNIRKAGKLNAPINEYLERFTDNHGLIDMISQHFFQNTPTFFALSYFGLYLNYSYPLGGTGVLAQRLGQYIVENQGELLCRARISKIDLSAKQVETVDGRSFGYRKLVWAADMKSLYASCRTESLKGKRLLSRLCVQRQRVMQHRGGDSVLTLYLGTDLDGAYFEGICGAHSFYTPVKEGLSRIGRDGWKAVGSASGSNGKEAIKAWLSRYLDLTTYEISCPSVRDAALAPRGKTGVIVSTLMDYDLVKRISEEGWYEEFKELCEKHILEVLTATLFSEMSGKISQAQCSTPLTIEKLTGNAQGAITGWAFGGDAFPAENRFQKIMRSIATPIPDVYQAGQWAFSPSGLPVSILTGKLAADAVHKKLDLTVSRREQR